VRAARQLVVELASRSAFDLAGTLAGHTAEQLADFLEDMFAGLGHVERARVLELPQAR